MDINESDAGLFHVMVTRSVEKYQSSKSCFQYAILMKLKHFSCGVLLHTERFKAGKIYVVDESSRMESVIRDIQLGTVLQINNVFQFSYYYSDYDWYIENKSTNLYLTNNLQYLDYDADYWLAIEK